MSALIRLLVLALSLPLAGCGLAGAIAKSNDHLPLASTSGSKAPYLIAHLSFSPQVEQGQLQFVELSDHSVKGVMMFSFFPDLREIDWDKKDNPGFGGMASIVFGGVEEGWEGTAIKQKGVSVIPFDRGTHYIRRGTFMINSYCRQSVIVGQGSSMRCTDYVSEGIDMRRDLKIEVPEGAYAVYIGKLVISHNGKRATSVKVVDAYDQALAALRKEPVPGLDLAKVQKRLAVLLPKK